MTQVRRLILLPAAALLLGGCVAGMVAGAAGMAAGGARERPHRNVEAMLVAARQACSAHAAQYGAVEVTGLEEADANEVIVSGIVTDTNGKNSFKCSFLTEITGFELRPVPAPARAK